MRIRLYRGYDGISIFWLCLSFGHLEEKFSFLYPLVAGVSFCGLDSMKEVVEIGRQNVLDHHPKEEDVASPA